MEKNSKIFVAGHRGLVGSALLRRLRADGFNNIITRTHADLDLTNQQAVNNFFNIERPDYVFLAAAKVGGIHANNTYPAEFIFQNIAIQTNVIHAAWRNNTSRLLFLGSSCIYPRDCPQPIKEDYFLTGPLEPTNRSYAVAKIAGIEMCWALNRQNSTQFLAVMPTNLYGPGDSYDPFNSHVIPALIRKIAEAKQAGAATVSVWGSGQPRREFLYSDDMAHACVMLMHLSDQVFQTLSAGDRADGTPPIVNIGVGKDIAIAELAQLIADEIGFTGRLEFDTSKPDGTPRKLLDTSRINQLGWYPRTSLREGINLSYQDFIDNVSLLRQ